jgi:hypothetical protein
MKRSWAIKIYLPKLVFNTLHRHPDIKEWDFYRYDQLPPMAEQQRVTLCHCRFDARQTALNSPSRR